MYMKSHEYRFRLENITDVFSTLSNICKYNDVVKFMSWQDVGVFFS